MSNTIEIVLRAIDDASAPLRQIGRELDALAARVAHVGSLTLPTARPFDSAAPRAAASASGEPVRASTIINVQMPAEALSSPARAQAIGDSFGEAIARRLRERG